MAAPRSAGSVSTATAYWFTGRTRLTNNSAVTRHKWVIAIDGVVGAGKSTTARWVADALCYRHIDTGAMYRAVTLAAIRKEVSASDELALAQLLDGLNIELEPQHLGGKIRLNREDVTDAIRMPEISRRVGSYADVPLVRRRWSRNNKPWVRVEVWLPTAATSAPSFFRMRT